jgi:uncharacterized membrane protein YfcA
VTGWTDGLTLVAAGVGAGICGSVAGLASLSSFPALLGAGLSPVAANVTNTIGLVGSSIGSVVGSRPELTGQRSRLGHYAMLALVGGIAGAALLLLTPSDAFAKVVPFLIGGSAILVLVRPRLQAALDARRQRLQGEQPDPSARPHWTARISMLAVGLYGGYFGAGAGVMMVALLALATGDRLVRVNALKNVLLGLANGVAAVGFAVFGPVHWVPAALLAIGCLGGGYVGPAIARAVPPAVLRVLIAVAGLYLAVDLGLDAYR